MPCFKTPLLGAVDRKWLAQDFACEQCILPWTGASPSFSPAFLSSVHPMGQIQGSPADAMIHWPGNWGSDLIPGTGGLAFVVGQAQVRSTPTRSTCQDPQVSTEKKHARQRVPERATLTRMRPGGVALMKLAKSWKGSSRWVCEMTRHTPRTRAMIGSDGAALTAVSKRGAKRSLTETPPRVLIINQSQSGCAPAVGRHPAL